MTKFFITATALLLFYFWVACSAPDQTEEETNQAPQILELTVKPNLIMRNQSTTAYCRSVDPEDGQLSFAWSAQFGTFLGSDLKYDSVITWVAPNFPCEIFLKCTVTDPQGLSTSDSALVNVLADSLEG